MSLILYFLKAAMLCIAFSAPIGPVGMICIRKSLEIGFKGALAVAVGTALSDTVYLVVAGAGLTTISHFLVEKANLIKICGGLVLFMFAYQEIRQKQTLTEESSVSRNNSFRKLVYKVFILALTSPITVVMFVGIFASIGGSNISNQEWLAMVAGWLAGGLLWWTVLGTVIIKIKHKIPLMWINRTRYISAAVLIGFATFAIWDGLK